MAVYAFGSNDEVQKYTGEPKLESPEAAKDIIRNVSLADYAKYGYGRLAVVSKAENKVIGFAGLKYLPEYDATDLGFRFLPEYWNKGIGTEASKAIVAYGFEELKLDRIIGITMKENYGSQRVLEKSGLKQYKIDEYDGDEGEHYWYEIHRSMPSS